MEYEVKHGFNPAPHDERDLLLGDVIGALPDPTTVQDFFIPGGYANDEIQETDDCSAFMTIGLAELHEGIPLDRKFQFAASKSQSGDPDAVGQDIRTALMTPVNIGCLPRSARPPELEGKPLSFLRYLTNWGDIKGLLKKAIPQKQKAATFITGPYDHFDNIKTSMWKFYHEFNDPRGVGFGTWWDCALSQVFIEGKPKGGVGHAMFFRGKKTINGKEWLIAQQSYGPNAGSNGLHFFDRERVNAIAEFKAGMLVDFSPAEIRALVSKGVTMDDPAYKRVTVLIINRLIALYRQLLALQTKDEVSGVPSKFLLPALIWQESEGNDNAIGDKHLVDKAYGCLQIRADYMMDAIQDFHSERCLGDRALSIEIFNAYMGRYATVHRLNRPVTDQDIARIHNGGPNGYKNPLTVVYWWNVRAKMKMLEDGTVPSTVDLAAITRLTQMS